MNHELEKKMRRVAVNNRFKTPAELEETAFLLQEVRKITRLVNSKAETKAIDVFKISIGERCMQWIDENWETAIMPKAIALYEHRLAQQKQEGDDHGNDSGETP